MGKLEGKVAIITGASRGIGKDIAVMFAAEGAKVVCAARSVKEGDHKLFGGSLNTTVAEIEAAGGKAIGVPTDIGNADACVALVNKARETFGPVDILVNNAAVTYFLPVKDMTLKQWDISWAVGMRALFVLTHEVLQDMIKKQSGAIVNISSAAAMGPGRGPYKETLRPGFGNAVYGAQKAAYERFTQGLAQEVYQNNISVTALSPSNLVVTAGTLFLKMAASPDDPRAEKPDMMAKAALLLASEPLDKVTGRVTYSQAILKEFGWIKQGKGHGIDNKGSGYAQI